MLWRAAPLDCVRPIPGPGTSAEVQRLLTLNLRATVLGQQNLRKPTLVSAGRPVSRSLMQPNDRGDAASLRRELTFPKLRCPWRPNLPI